MYNTERLITDISSVSHNFACENKIFINEEISVYTCSYMIADLISIIQNPSTRLIEFFINSPGGDFNVMLSIMNYIQMAKEKGLVVSTYVTGEAGSAASMLAVTGTKKYRYINRYAQHFVHFGSYHCSIHKESEISRINNELNKFHKICKEIYMDNTNIPEETLDNLMIDEQGYLNAKQCLKHGFADIII